jgi:hypothetical protein
MGSSYIDDLAGNKAALNSVGGYTGITRRAAPPGTFRSPIVTTKPPRPATPKPSAKGTRRK